MAAQGKTKEEKLFIYHTYMDHGIHKSLEVLKKNFDKISKTTIRRIVKELVDTDGLPKRDNSDSYRIYTLNKNYFSNIDTEEKAYWLGFIAADGSVHPLERRLSVHVSRKDRSHLQKLNRCLQSNRPIEDMVRFDGRYNKYRESSRVSFNSRQILNDLIKHNIVPNKTKTYEPALDQIPETLHVDFWRGYCDGDGSFFLVNKKALRFNLVGNNATLQEFIIFIKNNLNIHSESFFLPKNKTVWYLHYQIPHQVITISNFLYHQAAICLERKLLVVQKYKQKEQPDN
jgi:hypothetical protein